MAKLILLEQRQEEKAQEARDFVVVRADDNDAKKDIEIESADEKGVAKPVEFAAFMAWVALPQFFKRPPIDKKTRQRPSVRDFLESVGVSDEKVFELAELTTQKDFAAHYGVEEATLSRWKKKIFDKNLLGELTGWVKPMLSNVLMAHYNQCIRGGLPEHYKLFYQVVGGWNEKSLIDIRQRVIKTVEVRYVKGHATE